MKSFSVINLGCKVNRVESDRIADILADKGYRPVDAGYADLVVVNTCTVTSEADKKTRKAVRGALSANDHSRIIVTGCASAMDEGFYLSLSSRIEVVPKQDILSHLREGFSGCDCADNGSSSEADAKSIGRRDRQGIKIQDGCDNACTYCIVCKARGRSVSYSRDAIVRNAQALARKGIKEIVLSGINIGAYDDGGTGLHVLLDELLYATKDIRSEGEFASRFRISSIEPIDIDDGLIDLIARSNGRVCAHLHIPLQSGSSKVLQEMDRGYDAGYFSDLIDGIRLQIPNISISTDVIVGFPGETEGDFEETLQLSRHCRFSRMHIFPYSIRRGTPAAQRPDQVEPRIKKLRAKRLRELAQRMQRDDIAMRRGSEELFLIQENGKMMSESYHEFDAPDSLPVGQLVSVPFDKILLDGII